ncbi:RNA polymerase I enhancer binding protein [Coemansia sp. RSA 485]|nr:RNA polymerase I enhancer binding protein [Coemansia sp. RSA 485]
MLKTIQLAFSRPFLLAHAKSNFASTSRFVHSTTPDKPGSDRIYNESFKWTPEEDAKLLEIADKHPSKWTLIAEKLGTDKNLKACFYRWHRHHEIKSKPWTREEDERLAEIVDGFLKHAGRFTRNKIDWKLVSNMIGNNRLSYECKYRWTVLSNRTRENGANTHWTAEEIDRLDKAIAMIERLGDTDAIIQRTKQNEPWLLTLNVTEFPRPVGLGLELAARVKTKTRQQCLFKSSISRKKPEIRVFTHKDYCHLMDLVDKHGSRKAYIVKHYFPDHTPYSLNALVKRWENASKSLGVDLRAVDPGTMLISYDGDCEGVRLSGPDGYYDPNGVPMVVTAYKKTELVLYYLAHRRAYRKNQTKEIQKFLKY